MSAESASSRAVEQQVDKSDSAARGVQRGVERSLARDRVEVELASSPPAQAIERVDVPRSVDGLQRAAIHRR